MEFFLIIFVTLLVFLLVFSNFNWKVVLVLLLITITGSYFTIKELEGYPIKTDYSMKNIEYLGHSTEKPVIYVWIKRENHKESFISKVLKLNMIDKPITLEIPYTEENESNLNDMQKGVSNGFVGHMDLVTKMNKQGFRQSNIQNINILDPRKINQK